MDSVRRLFNIIFPCILYFFVQTVLDGVLAWKNIFTTLYVLFCFFTGRSHLAYPHPLQQLRKKKAEIARRRRGLGPSSSRASSGSTTTQEFFDSSLDDLSTRESGNSSNNNNKSKSNQSNVMEGLDLTLSSPSSSNTNNNNNNNNNGFVENDWWVQRRLLRGKKGEISEWLPKTRANPLVSPHYHLCYSESLHRLVSNIIGPIQQSTISALPTRHKSPQWPPHASGRAGNRNFNRYNDISVTTDDYSSSTSAQPRAMRGVGTNNITGSNNSNRNLNISSNFSSVVYRRESSKQVQFDRSMGSRIPLHPIASITSHHVLSYQATRQKVLIMDLDETLCFVSTKLNSSRQPPTFSEVIPTASGAELFHVWERPYVHLFINTMTKLFNVVLFTSSTKPYADSILRRLDPEHLIKRRYYRQHCRQVSRSALTIPLSKNEIINSSYFNENNSNINIDKSESGKINRDTINSENSSLSGNIRNSEYLKLNEINVNVSDTVFVKDLRILKVPPELMIMIDNVEECVSINRENALVLPPFFPPSSKDIKFSNNTKKDDVLLALIPFLEALLVVPDVRSILRHGKVFLNKGNNTNLSHSTVSDV